MNRLMRQLVDVAFRARAWGRARIAALEAGEHVPPLPRIVGDVMRAVVGRTEPSPTGSIYADVTDEQRHGMVRFGVALDWFAKAGCPIVSLDEETARGFASSPPPDDGTVVEWPLGVVFGLCIGQGAVLVRHQMIPTRMPENMREHFEMQDGSVPMEAWSAEFGFDGGDALANLTSNIGAAISRRPEGLAVTERHPSRQAARKQGLDPGRIPAVEYVIGSDIALGVRREPDESGSAGASDRSMRVRTIVSPHWTHQTCGPRGSQRRLQWIASHWRGPEDGPVSVHATRVIGGQKAPSRGESQ